MPQQKPTADDYWSTPDKEMVAMRGSFEYVSGLCCGYTKPNSAVPNLRNTGRYTYSINPGAVVYANQYNTFVYPAQNVPTSTTGHTIAAYNGWQTLYNYRIR